MKQPIRYSAKDEQPPDIGAMRAVADDSPGGDSGIPRYDDLQEWVRRLRDHLMHIVPVVEGLAETLGAGHMAYGSTVAALNNARVRLASYPGAGLMSRTQHAQGLARELRVLCDIHEEFVPVQTVQADDLTAHQASPRALP